MWPVSEYLVEAKGKSASGVRISLGSHKDFQKPDRFLLAIWRTVCTDCAAKIFVPPVLLGEKPKDAEMELLKNLDELSEQELKVRFHDLVCLRRSTKTSTDVIEIECHLLLLHREMDRRANSNVPSVV